MKFRSLDRERWCSREELHLKISIQIGLEDRPHLNIRTIQISTVMTQDLGSLASPMIPGSHPIEVPMSLQEGVTWVVVVEEVLSSLITKTTRILMFGTLLKIHPLATRLTSRLRDSTTTGESSSRGEEQVELRRSHLVPSRMMASETTISHGR